MSEKVKPYYAFMTEPLDDFTDNKISFFTRKVGIKVGDTIHVMEVPQNAEITFINDDKGFPPDPREKIKRDQVAKNAGKY